MPAQRTVRVTRLAPSPTGSLHLGNALAFLLGWSLARQRGWRIVLRIEDLDGPRIRPGTGTDAIEDLQWLGLDWDEGPLWQSHDLTPYTEALSALHAAKRIYPCRCTRREIASAASAPHREDHELRYPGTCRPREIWHDKAAPLPQLSPSPTPVDPVAWRMTVPDGPRSFQDMIRGKRTCDVARQVGDFVVMTKTLLPAYQLAVVVDDIRHGVTDVVRGEDLLDSTVRQELLYQILAPTRVPRHWHTPLVVGPDGRRLAKRHGDTRLAFYREHGTSPERIIALLARWAGIQDLPRKMEAATFCRVFDLDRLPHGPLVFGPQSHAWLLGSDHEPGPVTLEDTSPQCEPRKPPSP